MKKIELMQPYKVLFSNTTNVKEMDDDDGIILIKFLREIKPIVDEINDALNIAQEKLKGDNHDDIMAKFQKWNTISDDDKREVNAYLLKYNKDVENAIRDVAEQEVEIKNTLSEKSFYEFTKINAFDVPTTMQLFDCLVAK